MSATSSYPSFSFVIHQAHPTVAFFTINRNHLDLHELPSALAVPAALQMPLSAASTPQQAQSVQGVQQQQPQQSTNTLASRSSRVKQGAKRVVLFVRNRLV
ncbi:unnamed protein product [Mycena citricolor]|uniref:Uncharacterized protein n=1 Tax=Mycena citricolor TaxID=2018698 RepID=A0AAD2GZ25_9AGAR|nr:unnamed protein product [Mycena citricolor]